MNKAAFIAGDWGTTRLRLYLCSMQGETLDHAEGSGAAEAKGNFPAIFNSLVASWRHDDELPAILCGMVGSSIGWQPVPATHCPVSSQMIAQSIFRIPEHGVYIVPGLSCRNVLDAPDFIRGEETQILGALKLRALLREGRHLLCMPGTHTKWVALDDGRVEHFITAPTGELFALLCKSSVLVHDVPPAMVPATAMSPAFMRGVEEIKRFPDAGLITRIFECRSRRLSGELTSVDSQSFLSGLLVTTDVKDALALLATHHAGGEVTIIGTGQLCELYTQALSVMGCSTTTLSGDEAVRAGLAHVYQELRAQHVL